MDKVSATVIVNGQEVPLPNSARLMDLLIHLKLDARYVLIELNGEALFKDQLPATKIAPGDRLEIVKPVAGG